jgi:hypothetical protein
LLLPRTLGLLPFLTILFPEGDMAMLAFATPQRLRDLRVIRDPRLWSCWPFLPVVRRGKDGTEQQLGVLYDAVATCGRYGFSATVFLTNMFILPGTEEKFFALPRLVYDTAEEIIADG